MNLTSLFGIGLLLLTVYYGAINELPAKEMILNPSSIILVVGGTIAAFFIAFPMDRAKRIGKIFVNRMIKKSKVDYRRVIKDMIEIASNIQAGQEVLRTNYSHKLLSEGYTIMQDKSLDIDDYEYILKSRTKAFKKTYHKDYHTLVTLAKFPPAFGLLGSVTGIIAMLMNLGNAGKEIIGQGMAIALLTTFWGVAVANMLILPLADLTNRVNKEDEEMRNLIVEGLILIKNNESAHTLTRKLRSLLPLDQRIELSDLQMSVNKNKNLEILIDEDEEETVIQKSSGQG